MPDVILAKSCRNGDGPRYHETLAGHTSNVIKSAESLFEIVKVCLSGAFGIDSTNSDDIKKALYCAAWMHDWGKANNHFQEMIRNGRQQGIRHESVTWLIADRLEEWLSTFWNDTPRWVKPAVFYAVAGHHLKFPDQLDRPGTEVEVFTGHKDFATVLKLGCDRFGLGEAPALDNFNVLLYGNNDAQRQIVRIKRKLSIDFDSDDKIRVGIVKTLLMNADLAGSALPQQGLSQEAWIRSKITKQLTRDNMTNVVREKLGEYPPRAFQIEVQDAKEKTVLVEAGCGSGKTAAAYLWAAKHAPGKRLFFCYPTTTTASEGFSGYLQDPDFDALLVHGRARIDYELLENMPPRNEEEERLRQLKLEALETWPFPVVVCTAHTVLGMLENMRRGLYAFPSLVQGVFVFDEVHAFSETLFGYLLRFLEIFSTVPVLLMTATLPTARKRALEKAALSRGGLETILGPERRECAQRYRLNKVGLEEAWTATETMLNEGGKVLWVGNLVKRVMSLYERAESNGMPVELFHSRYRYCDRLKQQRAVVDGFTKGSPALLALTTQVAEMSLDLSADLLVSDYAPVPAMIQRLGRLNRFDEIPLTIAEGLFVDPQSQLPYSSEDWLGTTEWLEQVATGNPLSQRDLATAFLDVHQSVTTIKPAPRCEWCDGLDISLIQRPVEEPGYSMDVVLAEDTESEQLEANAIPMPCHPKGLHRTWEKRGRYYIAPMGTITYDRRRGGIWNNT